MTPLQNMVTVASLTSCSCMSRKHPYIRSEIIFSTPQKRHDTYPWHSSNIECVCQIQQPWPTEQCTSRLFDDWMGHKNIQREIMPIRIAEVYVPLDATVASISGKRRGRSLYIIAVQVPSMLLHLTESATELLTMVSTILRKSLSGIQPCPLFIMGCNIFRLCF